LNGSEFFLLTPFHEPPRVVFFKRHLNASLVAFAFGLVLVALLANAQAFQPKVSESPREFYFNWLKDLTHPPEVCASGEAVDRVEKVLCGDFWSQLQLRSLLAAAPILLWVAYLASTYFCFRKIYKKSEVKMSEGSALLSGIATMPVEASSDLFSWAFCLQPIGVQVSEVSQSKVYLPFGSPLPKPGDTVAIYLKHRFVGSHYLIGSAHLPHVTIMSGNKKSKF